ncbi:CD0415/CD1112 family protein (plasmid) [Oscillospiraceae bacterium PP1C4]
MDGVLEKISEWIKLMVIELISQNLESIFAGVNNSAESINAQVMLTPSAWNPEIWGMIDDITRIVMVPIAGIILTYVMCMELITLASDRNNMHSLSDVTQMLIKFITKTFIAVLLVQKGQDITMGLFDLGAWAVSHTSSYVSDTTAISIETSVSAIAESLKEAPLTECFQLLLLTGLAKLCIYAIWIAVNVILLGRMIEIYMVCSVGPIPFSTLVNKEWSGIGQNYIKALAALAFQGFFIVICVAVYNVLVRSLTITEDLKSSLVQVLIYTAALCFTLLKTKSVANSVFNAH